MSVVLTTGEMTSNFTLSHHGCKKFKGAKVVLVSLFNSKYPTKTPTCQVLVKTSSPIPLTMRFGLWINLMANQVLMGPSPYSEGK